MDINERDLAIRQFSDSPLHRRITLRFTAVVLLLLLACPLSTSLLPLAVCNYVIPMLMISGMVVLFFLAIRYQRNVTTMLDRLGLLCHACNRATVPRPDETNMRKRAAKHDNSYCYNCGINLP